MKQERLTAAAIKRGGEVLERGLKSHFQLRAALGDADPARRMIDDEEGFMTDTGRFVNRYEAKDIAIAAGQINKRWREAQRPLLSSDINW